MDNVQTTPNKHLPLSSEKKPTQYGWKSNLACLFSIVAIGLALCPSRARANDTAPLPQSPPASGPILTQEQRDLYYIVVDEYTVRPLPQPVQQQPSIAQTIENVSNPILDKKKERLRSDIADRSVTKKASKLAKLCTPIEKFLGYPNGNLTEKYLAISLIENSMNLEDPFQNNLDSFVSHLFEHGPGLVKRLKAQEPLIVNGMNYKKGEKIKQLVSTLSRLTGSKNDLLDPTTEEAVLNIKNDIVFALLITELHHAKYAPQALEAIKNDKGDAFAAAIEKAMDYSAHQIGGPGSVEMACNLEKPAKKYVTPRQLLLYGANNKTTCEEFLLLVASLFQESETQIRRNWHKIRDLEPERKMGAKSREKLPSADHS